MFYEFSRDKDPPLYIFNNLQFGELSDIYGPRIPVALSVYPLQYSSGVPSTIVLLFSSL